MNHKREGDKMEMTPTPHNGAKKGEIAKTVLMPGDPLRAKYIAETYLENPVQVTSVRNMLGFTGTYKGKEISVMGGGMGMPSMGIYSYELYHFYDVDQIIRIGSAGSLQDKVELMDVVIAMGACTDSNYAYQYGLPGTFAPIADYELLARAAEAAGKQGRKVVVGNVLSSDIFYNADSGVNDKWRNMGVLAVEMETAALYMNAAAAGKKALCMLTISDLVFGEEKLSAEERQLGFGKMIEIALEL
jgi:purine-nucleoside phosphorylase